MKCAELVTFVGNPPTRATLRRGRVTNDEQIHGVFCVAWMQPSNYFYLRKQDEGVVWCRGHVTNDSEAGTALLAAAALAAPGTFWHGVRNPHVFYWHARFANNTAS